MAYKMVAPEAPPSTIKTPKPVGVQKETAPTASANQDKLGKKEPVVSKAEEYGYIVTNQRYNNARLPVYVSVNDSMNESMNEGGVTLWMCMSFCCFHAVRGWTVSVCFNGKQRKLKRSRCFGGVKI